MMKNSSYNTIKLLHQLSEIIWFIEKHALDDAQNAGDALCVETLKALHANLEDQLSELQKLIKSCNEFK